MGWGGVGTAGETSASGRASCLGIPSLLGSSFQFPFTQEQQEMPARVLPKGRCSQRGGGDAHPVISSASSFPGAQPLPKESSPGFPRHHSTEQKAGPIPSPKHWVNFNICEASSTAPSATPQGSSPPGSDPAGGGHALLSGSAPCSALARRHLCFTLPLTFSGASLSLNFLSPAPPIQSPT